MGRGATAAPLHRLHKLSGQHQIRHAAGERRRKSYGTRGHRFREPHVVGHICPVVDGT